MSNSRQTFSSTIRSSLSLSLNSGGLNVTLHCIRALLEEPICCSKADTLFALLQKIRKRLPYALYICKISLAPAQIFSLPVLALPIYAIILGTGRAHAQRAVPLVFINVHACMRA